MTSTGTSNGIELQIAGETVSALPDRALFWQTTATLFVADLHLGKSTSFRAASIPVPRGVTEATLSRLSNVLRRSMARRLIVLGDLWHDKQGRTPEVEAKLCSWREEWPDLDIWLVTGNHDRRTGRLTEICGIVERESVSVGPFLCRHHPEPDPTGYVLCGHVHPAALLEGRASQALRLPCFWFGTSVGVLPAFGEMTGTADIEPSKADRVLAVADGSVFQILPRKQLN